MNEPQHRLGHGHLERLNHGCNKTAYLPRHPFLYCYNRSWDNNFRQREMWKILGFFKINFEEGCFSLLNLFHLRKKTCACYMQQDSIKYNSKNSTRVQSVIV